MSAKRRYAECAAPPPGSTGLAAPAAGSAVLAVSDEVEEGLLANLSEARRWFAEEFTPVVRMLRAADLVGSGTDAEAYMRVASQRYRLMRTHEWNDEVIERLRQEPS